MDNYDYIYVTKLKLLDIKSKLEDLNNKKEKIQELVKELERLQFELTNKYQIELHEREMNNRSIKYGSK